MMALLERNSAFTPHPRGGEDLEALNAIGSKLRVTQNQTIFSEGEPVAHAYKIVSGAVRLCKHLPNGRRQIAQFLFAGDYFSFVALGDHSFSAEAVTDVQLMSYSHSRIEQLCQKHPGLRDQLYTMLSNRVRDIQNHLAIVGRQAARERVASFLLQLLERQDGSGCSIELAMPRHDIADYLSLTTETISRILSQFKAKRILAAGANLHRLDVIDAGALEAMASCAE